MKYNRTSFAKTITVSYVHMWIYTTVNLCSTYIASLQTFFDIYVCTCVGVTKLLMASSKCPGCSGTSIIEDIYT